MSEVATLLGARDETDLYAVFHTIEGKRVTIGGGGIVKAYVLPGTRRVVVFGHTRAGALLRQTEVVADFEAGHVYKLRYELFGYGLGGKVAAKLWFEDLGKQ